jgi:hypothetical protein
MRPNTRICSHHSICAGNGQVEWFHRVARDRERAAEGEDNGLDARRDIRAGPDKRGNPDARKRTSADERHADDMCRLRAARFSVGAFTWREDSCVGRLRRDWCSSLRGKSRNEIGKGLSLGFFSAFVR